MSENWVHGHCYMSVNILRYIFTQYSARERTPVMISRVASYRPAFWKWRNIVQAWKFGPPQKESSSIQDPPTRGALVPDRAIEKSVPTTRMSSMIDNNSVMHFRRIIISGSPWIPICFQRKSGATHHVLPKPYNFSFLRLSWLFWVELNEANVLKWPIPGLSSVWLHWADHIKLGNCWWSQFIWQVPSFHWLNKKIE